MEKSFALCRDALKSSSFKEALTHALSILDNHQNPIDVDALRIACICHIYLNDLSAAREYAEKVEYDFCGEVNRGESSFSFIELSFLPNFFAAIS